MRREIIGAVVLVALGCAPAVGQSSAASASKTQTKSTQAKKTDPTQQREQLILNILQEAHAAAEELPLDQRIAIQKEVCGAASYAVRPFPSGMAFIKGHKVRDAPVLSGASEKQLREWSEELFRTADELTQGSYAKLDAQSVAVRAMVPVDANRAMEMLDSLDASDAESAAQQRNALAMMVFTEMLQKNGEAVVPDLRARAQAMGDNGQYPFAAMAAVTSQIRNKEMTRAIVGDAITAYQHSNDKLNSMFGMLAMVRNEQIRSLLAPSQVHEAALEIANQLKVEIDREQRAYREGQPERPGLWLIANSALDGLKDIDPELVSTISPLPPQKVVPARETVGGDTAATSAPANSQNREKLQSAFDKTSTRLMEMSEDEIHEGAELRQVIDRGIEQATELLRAATENAKDRVSALVNAMGPVTDLVQVGARTNPAMTLAAVRKVQDSEIRARMLVVIAQSLPDPRIKD